MFRKFAIAAAALASFAAAPAHATFFWVKHGHGDYGCGGHGHNGCKSPLQGEFTYDGNGGKIKDATSKKVWTRYGYKTETVSSVFTSSVNVAEGFTVADVNVSLNGFEHNSWGDLIVSLTHGDITVLLTKNQGGSKKADGTYIFDDSAVNLIGNTGNNWKAGTYNPFGSLSDFNGVNSAGIWTLTVYDTVKNGKAGELCDWTLQLTPTSEVPEPATWAMMIAGFGLVGLQLRRRRIQPLMVRA